MGNTIRIVKSLYAVPCEFLCQPFQFRKHGGCSISSALSSSGSCGPARLFCSMHLPNLCSWHVLVEPLFMSIKIQASSHISQRYDPSACQSLNPFIQYPGFKFLPLWRQITTLGQSYHVLNLQNANAFWAKPLYHISDAALPITWITTLGQWGRVHGGYPVRVK